MQVNYGEDTIQITWQEIVHANEDAQANEKPGQEEVKEIPGETIQRINDALPGLVLGIIVYGVIVELAGVWFVTDKVRYTTGLLIGISLACGMAVNIATVLRDAVELYGEDNAKKKIVAKSLLRYAVVVIVFFVMMKWNLGNLITAFIGVFQGAEPARHRRLVQ